MPRGPKPAETRMNGVNIEKKCGTCGEFKSLIEFNKRASGYYGTRSQCRECENAYSREYGKTYEYDKEKKKIYHKRYYENNREQLIEASRIDALKRNFNLTKEEFDKLCENGCYSCGSMDRLCVD